MIKVRHEIVPILFAVLASTRVFDATTSVAQNQLLGPTNSQVDLVELAPPDLTGADPQVQEQIRASQAALAATIAQTDASRSRRAEAFGNLGEIYEAYNFDSAALDCYTNASRLDPQSFRWSYYAGYLRQLYGDPETAERDYQHALTLKPNSSPALLRLGALELTLGHPDAAKQYFSRAAAQRIPSAPALVGLGKAALVEHQYSAALKYLTQALARQPQASSIHNQLAMAYRGLGDLNRMQEQMKARGNAEPLIQDPLLDEIEALKQGKLSLLQRGNRAMSESRFADAVNAYRQMVSLDPSNPRAYVDLGNALYWAGIPGEAMKQYAHSLDLNPDNATVHYKIGVLLVEAKHEEQAIAHFQQALKLDPGLVDAHFQLANLFMRKREDADAEREYEIVVSLEPENAFAHLMGAMAAIHAGSYARARTLLEEAAAAFSTDADIANALARLLAAAPDPAVRDPSRGLSIVETLLNNQQSDPLEVGITFAMALAAVGRFHDAAAYQETIIRQLEASRQYDFARLLRPNLARYQQGKTCRVPWASDDPIFTPVPGKVQLSKEAEAMDARH